MTNENEKRLVGLKVRKDNKVYQILGIEEHPTNTTVFLTSESGREPVEFDNAEIAQSSLYKLIVNSGFQVINDIKV